VGSLLAGGDPVESLFNIRRRERVNPVSAGVLHETDSNLLAVLKSPFDAEHHEIFASVKDPVPKSLLLTPDSVVMLLAE
jgi:hypothetical protein